MRSLITFLVFAVIIINSYDAEIQANIINGSEQITSPNSTLRVVAGYKGDTLSYDPFVIYYDDNATCNFDGQLDAFKLYNTDKNVTNFYVFGCDSSKLSIDAIPWPEQNNLGILRLGLKTEKDGEIIIGCRDITGSFLERSISIYDSYSGYETILSPDSIFRVYLEAGDYRNRFFLKIRTGIVTTIHDLNQPFMKTYSVHGIIIVDLSLPAGEGGILTITNFLGQDVFRRNLFSGGHYEFYPSLENGICFVSFVYKKKQILQKVYFMN